MATLTNRCWFLGLGLTVLLAGLLAGCPTPLRAEEEKTAAPASTPAVVGSSSAVATPAISVTPQGSSEHRSHGDGPPPGHTPGSPPGTGDASKPGSPSETGKLEDKKDGSSENKDGSDEKKDDETKSEPTQRPTEPPKPPDPKELELRPDKDGKIRFNFTGQPWSGVLQWLADVSHMSLDWQELPPGYLNLITQESYTLDEARDMINRHLLARGYTLLRRDELLSVVKIEGLNPGLLPRVEPDELDERDSHEIVKVSFPLDWLMADEAVEELGPMLSPQGKLTALVATNRLEAVDVVVNLREIHRLLNDEQTGGSQDRLVREFVLQYTKAVEVKTQLEVLLGVQQKSSPFGNQPGMSPDAMRQMQEAMQRAQQQQQQQQQQNNPGGKPPGASRKERKEQAVNLVINERKNSILANAPPDKMAIIEQAVKAIDVQSQRAESLLANIGRMQIYRLSAIDPEPLVETLQELGSLDMNTQLEIDEKNNAIIAYATLADHVTIRALIEKLDGSGRKFEVIQLRRLEADYVAGTVQSMLGLDKDKDTSRSNPWDYYSRRGNSEDNKKQPFRVDADVENNRLLLWANSMELDAVTDLLTKLGEIPPEGTNPATVRYLDAPDGEDLPQLIEQVRRAWPSVAPNPLTVPPVEELAPLQETDRPAPKAPHQGETPLRSSPTQDATTQDTTTQKERPVIQLAQFQLAQSSKESAPSREQEKTGPSKSAESDAEKAQSDTPTATERPTPAAEAAPATAAAATTVPATAPATTAPMANSPSANQDADVSAPPSAAVAPLKGSDTGSDQPAAQAGDAATPRQQGGAKPNQKEAETPPPITITREPDGRLRIHSQDPRALDLLEDLMTELTPPRRDYKVFRLKYASAYWVASNLEDFFKEDDNKQRFPWDFYGGRDNTDKSKGLSKRRPLRFISDTDTNTLLAQGADAGQLKTIEELIKIYDQPEATDSESVRRTETFQIQYSEAKVVADTIKEVYRDLLSSNDKALADRQQNEQRYVFSSDDGDQKTPRFKGLLSIGVDDVSNTLVVSAPAYLFEKISELVTDLDQAAMPSSPAMRVLKVSPGVTADKVREALTNALGSSSSSRGSSRSRSGGGGPSRNH